MIATPEVAVNYFRLPCKGRIEMTRDDKGQVRVIGGKLLPYELNHSPTDACQSLQLPH